MSKVIKAKTLAALYPSNKWKTRAVISRATTKTQKAYDEEFLRLQSLQQTYQSLFNFGKAAAEGYGSFNEARKAGYGGNIFNYSSLSPTTQGVWQDKFKQLNEIVLDKTSGELTLDDLYKNIRKTNKNITIKDLASKVNVPEDDNKMSGIDYLIEQSKKEAPPLDVSPTRPHPTSLLFDDDADVDADVDVDVDADVDEEIFEDAPEFDFGDVQDQSIRENIPITTLSSHPDQDLINYYADVTDKLSPGEYINIAGKPDEDLIDEYKRFMEYGDLDDYSDDSASREHLRGELKKRGYIFTKDGNLLESNKDLLTPPTYNVGDSIQ